MPKKIIKLGVLLLIKESYLLAKNVFGLGVHPFKTLRALEREKDRSQELLLSGLPVIILVGGAGVVWLGRRVLATSSEWGVGATTMAAGVAVMAILSAGYLSYWWTRVWLKK